MEEPHSVPDKFRSIISDFTNDLSTTFPEYSQTWAKWSNPDTTQGDLEELFQHVLTVYPNRFFDILNQNADIFKADSDANTQFLPDMDFKVLYNCEGISDTTRNTIWKYLQLILFTIVGSVKDKADFGDTANIFEGIDESDLHEKLAESIGSIGDFFSKMDETIHTEGDDQETSSGLGGGAFNPNNLPKPEDLKDHLKTLFEGKIGTLAKELAEEIGEDLAASLGDDIKNARSTKDVFAKLMQNPQRISGLVKTVGEKLNQKMSNGDISKDDIMNEAGDLMRRMKDMAGGDMGNFADMFKNMAKGMGVNIPKGAKIDNNALERLEKQTTARDKMKARIDIKKQKLAAEKLVEEMKRQAFLEERRKALAASLSITDAPNNLVFRLEGEDKQERSSKPLSNKALEDAEIDALVNSIEQPAQKSTSSKKKNKNKKPSTELSADA
jgi:hypothetical protein